VVKGLPLAVPRSRVHFWTGKLSALTAEQFHSHLCSITGQHKAAYWDQGEPLPWRMVVVSAAGPTHGMKILRGFGETQPLGVAPGDGKSCSLITPSWLQPC